MEVSKDEYKQLSMELNGSTCKPDTNVIEVDFFFDGLTKPGVVNNTIGSLVTSTNGEKIPRLNTLGVCLSHIDYARTRGLNPPHTHPRAIEMIFVLKGELDVRFITTANKLISKHIKQGEDFKNNQDKPASVLLAFNNQLPSIQSKAMTLLASTPVVPDHVLTKAFPVGTKEIDKIKTKFSSKS
ncbi:hypothetical protein K2173_006200 [Erythroxylum novogranatense]|uniref:Cupin type-1 domain-containing protein n=1 Tax=Erythroxylum novogranatense TaxID=1862640 RepID=A0AAV8TEL5_9ROSI|nr:hypothetical protein K2173_006200 [Erythroxylum novogranatense]